jgi:hypothetical protein
MASTSSAAADRAWAKLADQLERLNDNLEALVAELRLRREAEASKETKPVEPR